MWFKKVMVSALLFTMWWERSPCKRSLSRHISLLGKKRLSEAQDLEHLLNIVVPMFKFINDTNINVSKLITSPGLGLQGQLGLYEWMAPHNNCKLKSEVKTHVVLFYFHDFLSVSCLEEALTECQHNTQPPCRWKSRVTPPTNLHSHLLNKILVSPQMSIF